MSKPSKCAMCGADVAQPVGRGRPRTYCGKACRRAAEYELRRMQTLLLVAEREHMKARSRRRVGENREAEFWQGEINRLKAEQLAALAGLGEEQQ